MLALTLLEGFGIVFLGSVLLTILTLIGIMAFAKANRERQEFEARLLSELVELIKTEGPYSKSLYRITMQADSIELRSLMEDIIYDARKELSGCSSGCGCSSAKTRAC